MWKLGVKVVEVDTWKRHVALTHSYNLFEGEKLLIVHHLDKQIHILQSSITLKEIFNLTIK